MVPKRFFATQHDFSIARISNMCSRECEMDHHEVTETKNKTTVEDNKKS